MYDNSYIHTVKFKNPMYSSILDDEAIQKQIQTEIIRLNSYYLNSTIRQVSCKKNFNVSFECGEMVIIIETEKPLTNPKRKGQCMRQFSRFLLAVGFNQYLTSHTPKKLLSHRGTS